RLVHLQTAVFLATPVERLHRDLGFLARLWGGFSVRDAYFNLPQHRHNLLGLVPLHRHDRFSSKWILSHTTWYKNGRSRQQLQITECGRVFANPVHGEEEEHTKSEMHSEDHVL